MKESLPPSPRARPDKGGTNRSAEVLAYAETMDALCDLERVERAALRLIYWEGRSQEQVAADLQVPLATIRRGVARGLRLLGSRLTER